MATEELELPLAAELPALTDARRAVAGWLDGLGAPPGRRDAVVLAVHELVANAIEHGDPPVVLRGAREGDSVRIEVRDGGRLRARPVGDRGRGLLLASRCLASLEVVTGPSGTTVSGRASIT